MRSVSTSHPRAVQLDSLGFKVLSYLESQEAVKDLDLITKDGILPHEIALWEKKNVPYLMSPDLKAFYSAFNGFLLRWSSEIGYNKVPVGEMRVNSIDAFIRIPIDGRFVTSELMQAGVSPPDPSTCAAFLLDSFCEYGHVVIICRPPSRVGSVLEPEIWFQDLSAKWHFMCSSFKQYLRIMFLHLGISGWQMAFTSDGLPLWTQQWMKLFCKERLCIDLHNHASQILPSNSK